MSTESPQTSTPRLGSLRADQVNLTRERIIEAFVDQVAGSGFDDFSIERVARRAGVSPRTIYHHFPRRDDLLDAVNQRLTSRFGMEEINEPLETVDLLRLVERVFRRFDDHEPLIRAS
jgi:AcrR family transcriptional regulator